MEVCRPMQISTANLLIASAQGRPAPKTAEPQQSFASALAAKADGAGKTEKQAEDFAPLSFKTIEKPAAEPVAQKAASPYGAASQLGSQLNIVI